MVCRIAVRIKKQENPRKIKRTRKILEKQEKNEENYDEDDEEWSDAMKDVELIQKGGAEMNDCWTWHWGGILNNNNIQLQTRINCIFLFVIIYI